MADRDYYDILGVAKSSTPDQIKKAYRALARKHHPDVNPGDKKAEGLFKEVQKAYDVLSEPEKRKQYDQFGVAGSDASRAGAAEWAARQAGGGQGGVGGFENIDLSAFFNQHRAGPTAEDEGHTGSIFEELIGRVRGDRGQKRRPARSPRAAEANLAVPFLTAVRGGETPIEVEREPGRRESLVVKIPPGVETGNKIRLRGKGDASDLTVKLTVEPHPYFRREGRDLLVDAPVSIAEAILGARIEVPTLDGLKTLSIPAGASSGQKLRLRGQGVPAHKERPAGDLFVVVKIVAPKGIDEESRDLIQKFAERNPSKPRAGIW